MKNGMGALCCIDGERKHTEISHGRREVTSSRTCEKTKIFLKEPAHEVDSIVPACRRRRRRPVTGS
jgi:hypothetical protein